MRFLERFKTDERGATAVVYSLVLVPLLGFGGLAVDISRATATRSALQNAADATSLIMAKARHEGANPDYRAVFASQLKSSDLKGLEVDGQWDPGSRQFRTSANAIVPTTLFSVLRPSAPVGVVATAVAARQVTTVAVEGVNLSPEAADYNELSLYCYNPVTGDRLGVYDPVKRERLGFLKIADNTDEGVAEAPRNLSASCRDGETVSYHLKNVRNARTNPQLRRTGETWNHYTDTRVTNGVPRHNTLYRDLIETIVCETKEQCRPRAQGGILPDNHQTGRDPAVSTAACKPGQYLYFGWEDRPPNIGQWTDRDYDDIRLVMRCPGTTNGPLAVRLVE